MTFLSVMRRVEFCTQKEARGLVGVGSEFESTVHLAGTSMWPEHEAAVTLWERREMNAEPTFTFLLSQQTQAMDGATSRGVLLSPVKTLETPSQTCPELCLLGDLNPVDNDN